MLTFAQIETMASPFPGIDSSTSYGTPALKVAKKLIVRLHQKEDAIVVMLESVEEQKALIDSDPMTYYITDHYDGYSAVLVRPTVDPEALSRLIERAWRRVARQKDLAAFEAQQGGR